MTRGMLLVLILRYLALLVMGGAVFAAVYVVASAPSRVASRLGLRGLKRQRIIADNELWAQLEPLVRWFGVRLSGVLSDEQHKKLDEKIALSGDFMGVTPDEFVGLSIVTGIGGLLLGVVASRALDTGNLLIIPCGVAGLAMPYARVTNGAAERLKNISRGLPYVIDLMALAMGAGLDFPGAVRQVIDKASDPNDPLVEELTLLLQTLNLGSTRKEALLEFAKRAPCEAVKEFTGALIQAEERGNPVADVLLIQATSARQRRSVRAEELAGQAGVKIVGPLMLVFGCVLGLVLGPAMLSLMDAF